MRPWALCLLMALAPHSGAAQEGVIAGTGAVLRGLDKVDGDVVDMPLGNGEIGKLGRMTIELRECRYQRAAVSEAYAFLTISDTETGHAFFNGWMLASSPALNALEHPRYDVWVLGCKTE